MNTTTRRRATFGAVFTTAALALAGLTGCGGTSPHTSTYTSEVETQLYTGNDALASLCRLPVDDLSSSVFDGQGEALETGCDWQRLGLPNCEEDELCALANGPHHTGLRALHFTD